MYDLAKKGKRGMVALHRLVLHLGEVDQGLVCWERGVHAENEALFQHALLSMKAN